MSVYIKFTVLNEPFGLFEPNWAQNVVATRRMFSFIKIKMLSKNGYQHGHHGTKVFKGQREPASLIRSPGLSAPNFAHNGFGT